MINNKDNNNLTAQPSNVTGQITDKSVSNRDPTEVMHFGEITTNTPNVKKGISELFAKRFGQKITAMIGKKQVSTFGMNKGL